MEIINDRIIISVVDLIEALPLEEKKALARRMATECDVIKDVVDQLAFGHTEDCSAGYESTLHEQRLRLQASMSEVAARVVQAQQSEINELRARLQDAQRWESAVRHSFPQIGLVRREWTQREYCDIERAREMIGAPDPDAVEVDRGAHLCAVECNSCGSFPERADLYSGSERPGDRCPAGYLDDYDCDGTLIAKASTGSDET